MTSNSIHNESYQQLLNELTKDKQVIGEKMVTHEPGVKVRDASGEEQVYVNWDVIRRADETYWSVLDGDRKTLYNISDYSVYDQADSNQWLTVAEWFKKD